MKKFIPHEIVLSKAVTIFPQQLKDQILSLSHEVEECHSELEKLQQRRERENQEGTDLISMLKSDIDLSDRERSVTHSSLSQLPWCFLHWRECTVIAGRVEPCATFFFSFQKTLNIKKSTQ